MTLPQNVAATADAKAASPKPIVLVPACNRMLGEHPFHIAGKKYIDAVRLAGGQPLIVPSAEEAELEALLGLADGVLLTGSPSNVHPSHFGEEVLDPSLPLDPLRDSWTLPLIRRVIDRGIPLFTICRGTQETNVALGGSLYQAVHAHEGHEDHRGADGAPAAEVYAPAHDVVVAEGGVLAKVVGQSRFEVNSVHGQAVNRLADGLRVEARAPDGVVEAFSVADSAGFSLCVQWHPEWLAADNPVSMKMLTAFGEACRRYREGRRGPHP
ncbi:MAG TPA: gamma-glutamyl-gamma-aminobutyrate hydrolase family protein [Ideonella sp.]|uniref:gamma-glutamyl-gamma-aminobutyrate hydrolase family protein n=1 Tax=Ideonella sp. TaxID=1929293 RepID=UPI002E33D77C|nr:gamma-glutamyl-gamma-aminobutyrate hydrolase family protein [Ideonella sp.]HEX5688247.1 gamma-glutamyl-gamma-aminobutyrate hydrolase family protein [Ideonella sp.]